MSENLNPNHGAALPSPDRFKVNGDFLVRKEKETVEKLGYAAEFFCL
jgi:hypothetical protein